MKRILLAAAVASLAIVPAAFAQEGSVNPGSLNSGPESSGASNATRGDFGSYNSRDSYYEGTTGSAYRERPSMSGGTVGTGVNVDPSAPNAGPESSGASRNFRR